MDLYWPATWFRIIRIIYMGVYNFTEHKGWHAKRLTRPCPLYNFLWHWQQRLSKPQEHYAFLRKSRIIRPATIFTVWLLNTTLWKWLVPQNELWKLRAQTRHKCFHVSCALLNFLQSILSHLFQTQKVWSYPGSAYAKHFAPRHTLINTRTIITPFMRAEHALKVSVPPKWINFVSFSLKI